MDCAAQADAPSSTLRSRTSGKAGRRRQVGIAVSGWVLRLFGYVANAEQTPTALLGIRLFFGPVAAGVLIVSLPLLLWYPITRASHAKLLQEIARKREVG